MADLTRAQQRNYRRRRVPEEAMVRVEISFIVLCYFNPAHVSADKNEIWLALRVLTYQLGRKFEVLFGCQGLNLMLETSSFRVNLGLYPKCIISQ